MLGLILAIAVIGFLVWLLVTYAPMPAPFHAVIIFIAVLFLIVLVFNSGLLGGALGCGTGRGLLRF